MEVTMEEAGEFEISGCSSTTTIDDEMGYPWNDWSHVVDWAAFSGDDDVCGLIESMMDGDPNCLAMMDNEPDLYNSMASSIKTGTSTPEEEPEGEDDKGLRLVHLLMAAAEALTGSNKNRDLARVILVRLKELVSPAAAGSNMERLSAHFTDALQGLIDGSSGSGKHSVSHRDDHHPPGDVLAAFQLLQDMSPYVKFGHFTANQAILEAVSGDRRVHIVDYDIMEGIQWASLMQALVSRKDGPPAPHLRITAITRGGSRGGGAGGRAAVGTVQETGRRLVAFAASIGQPFSFGQCRLDPDEKFRPAGLKMVKGEALVVNCMLHLPHFASQRTTESVESFLTAARGLNPRLITLVEEEIGVRRDDGFVGRFMDALHHYSAVYDSLEAGFPMQGMARGLVERVFLGPRIAGTVGRVYRESGEREGWGKWMEEMGFGRVGISFFNNCQAKLLLGLFHDGYRVEEVTTNKLVLGWKSRQLLSASIWSSASASSPPPPPPGPTSVTANPEDSDFLI